MTELLGWLGVMLLLGTLMFYFTSLTTLAKRI